METLAERAPTIKRPEINQELRVRNDTTTWLAETLHGSMRTSFEFTFDGQELRGEDGGSINEVFDSAIAEAREMTEWQPSMLFELRRRLIEREELHDMYDMLNGTKPNTMIVISDFPPELMNASQNIGGYNVNRQQTMMRVITLEENGKFRVTSQSLDSSNRQALEAIYAGLGEPVQAGELLSQRIHRDMSPHQQEGLSSSLTRVYDDSLTEQYGGEWHAGISQRPDRNMVNTYDFVLQQRDLVELFTSEKLADPTRAEKLRYKIAATASARHKRYLAEHNHSQTIPGTVSYESIIKPSNLLRHPSLLHELDREGAKAVSRGEEFNGCGFTTTAEEEQDSLTTTTDHLSNLGYGNKRGPRDKYGSLTFECRNGHKNTREPNKLIDKCKTCGTSVKC